jgi:uridine kinase
VCRYADVIIPWQEGDNIVAIDLVTEHIKTKLQQHNLRRIYPNLEVMPLTKQVCGSVQNLNRLVSTAVLRPVTQF